MTLLSLDEPRAGRATSGIEKDPRQDMSHRVLTRDESRGAEQDVTASDMSIYAEESRPGCHCVFLWKTRFLAKLL
jgi:ribose 1,5-bisphosphokinase PhnN